MSTKDKPVLIGPTRAKILQTGMDLTCGDRSDSYNKAESDGPYKNMRETANFWTNYLNMRGYQLVKSNGNYCSLNAEDVANMMALLKIARTGVVHKEDNYVDGATYLAIAGECSEIERSEDHIKAEIKL